MPFAIDSIHRQFFHTQGWVQFDEVIGQPSIEKMHSSLATFCQKMEAPGSSAELGRDWHLKESWANKLAIEMGSVASGLWNERPLVLLGDQLLYGRALPTWLRLLQEKEKQERLGKAVASSVEGTGQLTARAQAPLSEMKGLSLEEVWSADPMLGVLVLSIQPRLQVKASTGDPSMATLASGSLICLKSATPSLVPPVAGQILWMFVFGTQASRYNKAPGDALDDYYRRRGVPENGRLMLTRPLVVAR